MYIKLNHIIVLSSLNTTYIIDYNNFVGEIILIKKRYLFLIIIVCLFAVSTVSAAENITDNIVNMEETQDDYVNVEFSEINDCNVNNDFSKEFSMNDSNDEKILYSVNDDDLISGSSSTYPSYSDYSVSVSDTTINYGSGGSISMSISPSSGSGHKYDYYLRIYDSSNNLKISQRYYSNSSSYSNSYNVGAYELSPGTYTVKIVNYDDDVVMDTAKLTVKDTSNKLSAPDVTKYYGGSEKFVVKLTDNAGNPLSGQSITITLNGAKYTRTTDSNGQTSMAINLNSGKYDITTEYNGKKVYSTATVKDTVISKDFSKIYKNGTQYYGTFVDSKGNPLKNTDVKININGVFYTRTTDSKGVARMNINLNPGTYVLTAKNPSSGAAHNQNHRFTVNC